MGVFRAYKQGNNTLQDWEQSIEYGINQINEISDPTGFSPTKEITSIPSPFARFDLIRTAFKEVNENFKKTNTLDGDTMFHRLVSDCFDVGQLFFEHRRFSNDIEIIPWYKETDLPKLLNSNIQGNKELGKAYDLYMNQNVQVNNYDKINGIYLLNYKKGPKLMNILGGTSPTTLFFTPANNLEEITSKKIHFGDDIAFDNIYRSLYKRDFNYIKYYFCLSEITPHFVQLFPEVNEYLTNTFSLLKGNHKNVIQNLLSQPLQSEAAWNEFIDLSIPGTNTNVEILGTSLKMNNGLNTFKSGFEIKTTINQFQKEIPLALPVTTYTKNTCYTLNNWVQSVTAPEYDSRALNQRTLPADGRQYPYLTLNDFLEDKICKIDQPINYEEYFDGHFHENFNNENSYGFLLPLKQTFFDYFTIEDLESTLPDGKKMFELLPVANEQVKAVLRIPITDVKNPNSYITYEKIYLDTIQQSKKKGQIVKSFVAIGLFPSIKYKKESSAYYRIAMHTDTAETLKNYNLAFYLGRENIDNENINPISKGSIQQKDKGISIFAIENTLFDRFQLCNESLQLSATIIPLLRKIQARDKYTFAVDFGTTNSYIVSRKNKEESTVFKITEKDKQLSLLCNVDADDKDVFIQNLLPFTIGPDENVSYPCRTALTVPQNINWNQATLPMGHANIPFLYEKALTLDYLDVITGLKWSNNSANTYMVKQYIESIFMMLRNKVLLNNGKLEDTKVIWFYPTSMNKFRYDKYKQIWEEAYLKYFGKNKENIISMTESISPYYYYNEIEIDARDWVNIDIGGETSDVVIVKEGIPHSITSFRFAANAVLGDANTHIQGREINAIIRSYLPEITQVLGKSNLKSLNDLLKICTHIEQSKDSTNMASLLFSLKDNKEIKRNKINDNVDFIQILNNESPYKLIFVLFYTAILYHVANYMKASGLTAPKKLSFSGNGSKLLQIITNDNSSLSKLAHFIFQEVYNSPLEQNIEIARNLTNPKEITCIGGANLAKEEGFNFIEDKKNILLGLNRKDFAEKCTYKDIIDTTGKDLLPEIQRFCAIILSIDKKYPFYKNLGIKNEYIHLFKKSFLKDIDAHYYNALKRKLKDVDDTSEELEETLFFLPFAGLFHTFAEEIYKNESNKKK